MPSEREKMLAGELYLAANPELVELRLRARRLTARLNALPPDAPATERDSLCGELFAAFGPGAFVEPPFRCDHGCFIELGARAYLNFGCVVLDCGWVRIGAGAKFGPGVHLYGAHHPIDPAARRDDPRELGSSITVGSNAWVGGGAILLPGTSVGENSVVGAGSVVTRPIPANVVAVGNPCRVLRAL